LHLLLLQQFGLSHRITRDQNSVHEKLVWMLYRLSTVYYKDESMNTIGYFEIQSTEPQRDIRFYESIFGWTFIREEFVPIEYYRIQTNSINGGLLKRPAKVPPTESGANAFVCSIQVQNFDTTAQLVLQHGGQVALLKFAIPGRCWQGYFSDLDNNTFGIFEVDEKAK
jgi:predicted enzyme related to lactoylglutathione lyase